jgi:L-fuconolactonase
MRILDSHVHFWDPSRLTYPWLASLPKLRRAFTPDDYRQATAGMPVAEFIFVEAASTPEQTLAEIDWIHSLRADEPRLCAMAARVELSEPGRDRVLEQLAAKKSVVSVRNQSQSPGFYLQQSYTDGVRAAAKLGFAIELCIGNQQMPELIALVAKCPDARFVLDHCGKPGIKDKLLDPWRDHLRQLARFANVSCKISALLTEAAPNWKPDDFAPYLDHVVQCFGHDRILYGGDWPVLTLAGTYADWLGITETMTRNWSAEDQDLFFYGNAQAFYRI